MSFSAKRSCSISKHLTFKLLSAEHLTDLSNQLILLLLIQILTICAFNQLIESAQSIFSSMLACSLMLSFLDSIFFDSNFLTYFSVIFLFSWSYSCVWDFDQIYCHKQLFCFMSYFHWKISHLFCFSSYFVSLFKISVKSTSTSCYSISCSIFRKDLLFAFLNIWSHAAFLGKILFSSLNFNTEASISLAFVYYEW